MRIVIGMHHLVARAGAELSVLTVAEQLERLRHEVVVFAVEQGPLADEARERGVSVLSLERELPEECDGLITNDVATAYMLGERYPGFPHLFMCRSDFFEIDTPPQIPGVVSTVVALSDRVASFVEATAHPPPVVRLRQPVDLQRFADAGTHRARAEQVVAIGNYLRGARRELLAQACREAGLRCDFYGGDSPPTDEPEAVMAQADIVVGKGRVILEAMACGRAAYVYDFMGSDGWVTPESYPAQEADAFFGRSDAESAGHGRLAEDLRGYEPEMGPRNRELAVAHHDASAHAQELVALLRSARDNGRPELPPNHLAQMGLLARRHWMAESELFAARRELAELRSELDEQRRRADEAERRLGSRGTDLPGAP